MSICTEGIYLAMVTSRFISNVTQEGSCIRELGPEIVRSFTASYRDVCNDRQPRTSSVGFRSEHSTIRSWYVYTRAGCISALSWTSPLNYAAASECSQPHGSLYLSVPLGRRIFPFPHLLALLPRRGQAQEDPRERCSDTPSSGRNLVGPLCLVTLTEDRFIVLALTAAKSGLACIRES